MNWITVTITISLLFLPFVSNGVDVMGKTTYKLTTPDGAAYYFSEPDCVVNIGIPEGLGMPPLDHNTMTVYKQPGALLTGIQVKPRIVTITATLSGDCRLALHQARAALFSALRWNRTNTDPPSPATLTYTHDGKAVNLKVHYLSDVTNSQGETADVIGVRLIAYDPMWYATSQTTTAMLLSKTFAVAYIVGLENGEWSSLAGGLGSTVYAMATAPDGTLYANGSSWNGVAWSALGVAADGPINALAVGPDGTLYAGGAFANIGGIAASNIAKWNGAAWSALGTGMNNSVNALVVGPDGILYAGGTFTTAGGGAAFRVAQWNGAAWSAVGVGMSAEVHALAIAPGGKLYAAGDFLMAYGYISQWDGSAWSQMGSGGPSGAIYALVVGPDGSLYAGGAFTLADSVTVNYISKWNGASWSALGTGMNNTVWSLAMTDDGTLYAGGAFSTAGGIAANTVAQWTGTFWAPLDITLPATSVVVSLGSHDNNIYIGFTQAGNAVSSDNNNPINLGNTDVYPIITLTGPGTLSHIINETTERAIFFDLQINAGETVVIDLSPGIKTITSDWRGNMMPYAPLLPQSDFATFALAPDPVATNGSNNIRVLVTGTTVATHMDMLHTNAYLTADDAVR